MGIYQTRYMSRIFPKNGISSLVPSLMNLLRKLEAFMELPVSTRRQASQSLKTDVSILVFSLWRNSWNFSQPHFISKILLDSTQSCHD